MIAGASGAVYALLACNALLDQGWTVYIAPFGLHASPLGMLTVRLAIDMLAACMGGIVDFWAHLGGTATGLLYVKYLLRDKLPSGGPWEMRME